MTFWCAEDGCREHYHRDSSGEAMTIAMFSTGDLQMTNTAEGFQLLCPKHAKLRAVPIEFPELTTRTAVCI